VTAIKLASVNIERSNHLERVVAFLRGHQPDVLCLQEVCARDLPLFERELGQPGLYAPMTRHPAETEPAEMGVAVFARAPLGQPAAHYYVGNGQPVPVIRQGPGADGKFDVDADTIHRVLVCATVGGFRIATTHLTWTQCGASTPGQLHDAGIMLKYAEAEATEHGGLVLCGDFNAPRGRETFSKIAEHFKDGIPPHYKCSLDLTLHRVRHNPAEAVRVGTLMVDGLFHTGNYHVADVELSSGVSDHLAVTATLSKA
jgi:endonuclease/exonuclease/phosphatase family metal-dependent hydrolase